MAKGDTGTGRVEDSSPKGANPVGVTGIDGPCVPTQKRPTMECGQCTDKERVGSIKETERTHAC